MKNRRKQLLALCLTTSLCVGAVPVNGWNPIASSAAESEKGQTEAAAETVEKQTEGKTEKQTEAVAEAVEKQTEGKTEKQTETAAETLEKQTEGKTEKQTEIAAEKQTETTVETVQNQTEGLTETAEQQTEAVTETGTETVTEKESAADEQTEAASEETAAEQESETESEMETEEKSTQLVVTDDSGEMLPLEAIIGPQQLTVGSQTYPVDYAQGIYRIYVPEGTQTIRISDPDQEANESRSLTQWNGYLTESEQTWLLCPDEPMEAAYTEQAQVYTVNLEQYALDLEQITAEQLAVYGDLERDLQYAEIFVLGEGRSEVLLVEYVPDFAGVSLLSATAAEAENSYTSAGKNLSQSAEKYIPSVSSINGEWQILGLARSDASVKQSVYDQYVKNVIKILKECDGVLHAKKYTEYSRVVLALTSLGYDVTNVAGYNLLQPLADYDKTVWQGINGAAFALIAFDSHDYEIPAAESGKTQNSRAKLIQTLLDEEVSGGGWDLSGQSADPDMTAMVMQALAPYYNTDTAVRAAVDRGLAKLSAIQKSDGAYATYGTRTSESCAQVVVALTALGIDPNTDPRFTKNGISVLEALIAFQNKDGSFRHIMKGEANQMATEQAYYALTAYERFINGKTSLYDMTDVVLQADRDKAAAVEQLIQALPEQVTAAQKDQVQQAWNQYNALSKTQKSLISTAQLTRLQNAAEALKELDSSWSEAEPDTEASTEKRDLEQTETNDPEQTETNNPVQTETNKEKETETEKGGSKKDDSQKPSSDKVAGGTTKKVNLVSSGTKTGGTAANPQKKQEEAETETESETETEEQKNAADRKGATPKDEKVTDLILDINTLFRTSKNTDKLSEDGKDYTEVQISSILEIYREYTGLSEAQQEQVAQGRYYPEYQKALEQLKAENHYDEATGTDLSDNEEEILPWYIRLAVSALTVEQEKAEAVREVLKGQGELLTLQDISLEDLLDGGEWQPEDLLRVSIPMTDLGSYEQVAIVHLKDDGSMEFITAHIAGDRLEFDTDHFSRFGIVGYNGTMEELMQEQSEETFWIYLIPGGGAALLLLLLVIARAAGSRKKEEGKYSER